MSNSSLIPVLKKSNGQTLIIGIILPLIMFGFLAFKVSQSDHGLSWDIAILLQIHDTARPFLDQLATNVTNLGHFSAIIILILPIIFLLIYQKKWRLSTYLVITIIGNELLNNITKIAFHRLRPHLWESISYFPSSFSFPSGHAMGSMTFVMALLILGWGSRWSLFVAVLGFLYVLIIGWTRLYLGVHFPSDILGGWLLAIAWTISMSLLFKIRNSQSISK